MRDEPVPPSTGRAIPYIRKMQRPFHASEAEQLAALVELGDGKALAAAEAILAGRAPAPGIARELAMAFGRRGDEHAVEVLTRLLRQTRHQGLRESALRALARCRPRDALEPLADVLKEGPQSEAKEVVAALLERKLTDASELLLLVARGEDETLKKTLVQSAASRPGCVPFAVLDALSKAGSAEVRELVTQSLAPTRQAMTLLGSMTDDPHPAVRAKVEEKLAWLREAAELL